MTKLSELIEQRDLLNTQITELAQAHKTETIDQIRILMTNANLTLADLGASPRSAAKGPTDSARKVAAKYRDAAGNSWSGRGLKPKWLKTQLDAGASIDDFKI